MSGLLAGSDVELLQGLDFAADQTCELDRCKTKATHLAVCPCGTGSGYACSTHAKKIEDARHPKVPLFQPWVRFFRTCGHSVPMTKCRVQPL